MQCVQQNKRQVKPQKLKKKSDIYVYISKINGITHKTIDLLRAYKQNRQPTNVH